MSSSEQRTMKPSRAFALMGIAANTGYRLIKAGTLRAFKIGNRWLIPVSELKDYMNKE